MVVLGAGGLLGRHLVEELRRQGGDEVVARSRAACDIEARAAVAAACAGAEAIVNCAAFTNVDGAEREEEAAYRVNAIGAENVARVAAGLGARLVHVSTDFVFDGEKTEPYDELDLPRPLSVYARSKWAGERLVERALDELYLVRVQGLYGRGGSNFASKLRELIMAQKPLKLDGERRVQPTWARAAARQIVALLGSGDYGTYHVSCKGESSWAGFTKRLAERLALAPSWQVVASAALGAPAPRPPNCLFRHRMLGLRGLDRMPSWEAAQDEYLEEETER